MLQAHVWPSNSDIEKKFYHMKTNCIKARPDKLISFKGHDKFKQQLFKNI